VINGFVSTFDTGISAAAFRELPMIRGTGNRDDETKSRSTAFWSQVCQGILFSSGILIYMLFFNSNTEYTIAYIAAAIIIIANSTKDILITIHQAAQQYVTLGKILLSFGILCACLVSVGTWLYGLMGLITGAIISQVLLIIIFVNSCRTLDFSILLFWKWSIFKRLIRFGVSLRIVDYPQSIFTILDVLIITRFIGVEALAIYSTAKAIVYQVTEIPSRIGTVMITRILEFSGTENGRKQVSEELRFFLLAEYFFIIPLVACLSFYAISCIIVLWLPKYVGAISVMHILICIMYFIPQTSLVRNFWIMDKRMGALAISNMIGLLGISASLLIAYIHGLNLESITWGVAAGYCAYYIWLMFSVGQDLWGLKKAIIISLSAILSAIYVYSVISILPVTNEVTASTSSFIWHSSLTLLRALIFLIPLLTCGVCLLFHEKSSIPLALMLSRFPLLKKFHFLR